MGARKPDNRGLAKVINNKLSLTRKKDEMNMNTKKINKAKKNNKMKNNKMNNSHIETDLPFLSPPRLDGIRFTVPVNDPQLLGIFTSEIIDGIESGELFKIKTHPKTYAVAANIPCPDAYGELSSKNPCVCIMATPKNAEHRHVLVKFNPEKLLMPQPDGTDPRKVAVNETIFDHLDGVFTNLFSVGFFEFIAQGRVTGVDIHRQIAQRNPDDYMFNVKYSRSCQSIFGSDGKLGTMYFGKRASNQVVIYDKAREMHGKDAMNEITRVEYRLKPKKISANGLWSLENPFKKIIIHSLKCDNPPFGEAHLLAFQDSCRMRGVAKAIAYQPKPYRHALKKALSEQPVSWWQMSDADWFKYWHDALEDCGLNRIPDHAPPLTMVAAVGMAA